jgi:hypothetical protein
MRWHLVVESEIRLWLRSHLKFSTLKCYLVERRRRAWVGKGFVQRLRCWKAERLQSHQHRLRMHVFVVQRELKKIRRNRRRLFQRVQCVFEPVFEIIYYRLRCQLGELPPLRMRNDRRVKHRVAISQARRQGVTVLSVAQAPVLLEPSDVGHLPQRWVDRLQMGDLQLRRSEMGVK